ncbi:MAG: AMP-binding protein, partial [Myxococcota bacterium]
MRTDPGPDANVGTWLALHAAERPEHTALVVESTRERISYRELESRIRRAAAVLAELGLARGDRIALALPSDPLYLELYFAAALLGAIAIPLNTRLTAAELGFQLDD